MVDGGCTVSTRRSNWHATSKPSCMDDLAADHASRIVTTRSALVGVTAGVGAHRHA